MSKDKKIVNFPKSNNRTIGIFIVIVIFIYVVYHLFTYITKENITIYEVSQGTISSDKDYNALAIRDESVVYADNNGSIVYLANNVGRVGVKSPIYALDTTGNVLNNINTDSINLNNISPYNLSKLEATINSYVIDYSNNNFSKVYSFKADLASQLNQIHSLTALDSMSDVVAQATNNGTFRLVYASEPGVIVYSTDGYEGINLDNYNSDAFNTSNLTVNNLKSQENVVAGQQIYKIIKSDIWHLILPVDANLAKSLSDDNYVEIRFLDDNVDTWCEMYIEEKAGQNYLVLTLNDSMERYAANRFIHVKILDSDIVGLKIPNSSIVSKEFFTIPKSCFYSGESSSDLGLIVKGATAGNDMYINPTIYYETDDYYYIDSEKVEEGSTIITANSNETYTVGSQKASLKGVYNVNKGFAVFKQINIKLQNADYAIVESGTNYGIALYDHIVLQGNSVEENQIIN